MGNGSISRVVWDWNGTLVDDVAACVASLNVILVGRGLAPVSRPQYLEHFGFPVEDYYRVVGIDFNREPRQEVAAEFHALYDEASRTMPLREGVEEILAWLRAVGLPMSVLSAAEQTVLEETLARRGIRDFFDRVYGLSDLYASSKIVTGRRLLADAAVPPGSILVVGDTIHDYEVASDLGCRCVLVAGGHQAEHRLAGCGCPVLPDIPALRTLFDDEGRFCDS